MNQLKYKMKKIKIFIKLMNKLFNKISSFKIKIY